MIKYVMAMYLPEESKCVENGKIMDCIKSTFTKDDKEVTIVDLNHMNDAILKKFIETGAIDTFVFSPDTITSEKGRSIITKVLKADIELDKNTQFLDIYSSESEENIQKAVDVGQLLLSEEYMSKLTHLAVETDTRLISQNLLGMRNDAIKTRKKLQEKDENILSFATRVVKNIELEKDEYTAKHIRSVAAIAEAIARNMGLSNQEIDILKIGALLHDMGKEDVADFVLKKPSRLTDDEFKEMKQHVAFGEMELNQYDLGKYERAKIIAAEHHEKFDGTGYPRGLKGEEIDVLSRIAALADATQAMFGRSYQSGRTKDDLITELRRCAGTQFDPAMVEILCDILDKEPESIHVSYDEEGKIKYEVPSVEEIVKGPKPSLFLESLRENVNGTDAYVPGVKEQPVTRKRGEI